MMPKISAIRPSLLMSIIIVGMLLGSFSSAMAVQMVAAGSEHSVVLREDGTVWVWGDNSSGQLGDGTATSQDEALRVTGLPIITAIATGGYHNLALSNTGVVWSWGGNQFGQLGDGSQELSMQPKPIATLPAIKAISAGIYFSLALAEDGTVWAWGDNGATQLGVSDIEYSLIPLQVGSLSQVTKIASGAHDAYAQLSDGSITVWGEIIPAQRYTADPEPYSGTWEGILRSNRVAQLRYDPEIGEQLYVAYGIEHSVKMTTDGRVYRTIENASATSDGMSHLVKNELVVWNGHLTVNIQPEAARASTYWRVAKGDWKKSGEAAIAPAGEFDVDFVGGNAWHSPTSQTITIEEGKLQVMDVFFTPRIGSINIEILPAEVVSSGARWRLNGGEWQHSGATLNDLPPGEYTLDYEDVPGWKSPILENSSIQIVEDRVLNLTHHYQAIGSAVKVVLEPEYAVAEGAQWRIAGRDWRNSGDVEANLSSGYHEIEFSSTPSWSGGESIEVNLQTGEQYQFSQHYQSYQGSIVVNLFPTNVRAEGAKWRINGGVWRNSGDRVASLAPGNYQIETIPVEGWSVPATMPVTIQDGDSLVLNQIYINDNGSLQVNLVPAKAIKAGAQWRLEGGGWNDSGVQLGNLTPGVYQIEYKATEHWQGGEGESVEVKAGEITLINRRYQDSRSSLEVTLAPQAVVDGGGQWRVAGGSWQSSGTQLNELSSGDYVIEFSSIDGWQHPDPQHLTLQPSTQQKLNQIYAQLTGSVEVILSPQAIVDAGGAWRIDGGSWRESGDVSEGLLPGSHTVEFVDIDGWVSARQAQLVVAHSATLSYQHHYQLDTDNDGIANEYDSDDDADGISDEFELANGMDPLDASDAQADWDGDGVNNLDEYLAGSDIIVDSLPPQLILPDNQVLSATGYLTWVEVGQAEAFDVLDGILPATTSQRAPFKAGRHEIIWHAEDSAGNQVQSAQHVTVIPQLNFYPDQRVVEGGIAKVGLQLSGEAADYPVTVEYRVSGNADALDHDAENGVVVIDHGVNAEIHLNLWQDNISEGDEQIVFELLSVRNAVPGRKTDHRISIAEENLPATVTLQAYQDNQPVTTLLSQAGIVEVVALLEDSSDLHGYDWSASDQVILGLAKRDGGTLSFNPETLLDGSYQLVLTVTEPSSPQYQQTITQRLQLLMEAPHFSESADSDDDGLSDLSEGLQDQDGDNVADYLDDEQQQSVLLLMGRQDPALVVQAEPGLTLALGAYAIHEGKSMPYLQESDLNEDLSHDYQGGISDLRLSNVPHGSTAKVVIPLLSAIPEDGVVRYYQSEQWEMFIVDEHNFLASATSTDGFCAAPGDSSYLDGLTTGSSCLQLAIEDGGPNDGDGQKNGAIDFTGGMAIVHQISTRHSDDTTQQPASGGGGCTIGNGSQRDPTLPLLLLLSLLYLWRCQRRR